mmetsp:Transcript_13257/g.22500  ORF Transcript_13257/g.22500 Transcript_13257/m.22500 type:complete len:132 (-) Transcript_13257:115-510(-)
MASSSIVLKASTVSDSHNSVPFFKKWCIFLIFQLLCHSWLVRMTFVALFSKSHVTDQPTEIDDEDFNFSALLKQIMVIGGALFYAALSVISIFAMCAFLSLFTILDHITEQNANDDQHTTASSGSKSEQSV